MSPAISAPKTAIYYRCSTDQQDIESQQHAVGQWLVRRGIAADSVQVFSDEGISGKTDKRPGFRALCAAVEAGEVDTVVTFRLDRLSRNAITALRLLLDWMQRDVAFFATEQPILQLGRDNPMRLTVSAMLAEFAQLEREATVARVKAGLAAARARGVRLGAVAKLDDKQVARVRELKARGLRHKDIAKQMQVSPATISRALQRREA